MREDLQGEKIKWIHIVEPDEKEINTLSYNLKLHELTVEDLKTSSERAKIDFEDNYIFLVLQLPKFNRSTKIVESYEIDLIIGKTYVATVSKKSMKSLNLLFEEMKLSNQMSEFENSGYLLYEIVVSLVNSVFKMLKKENANLQQIEKQIFIQDEDDDLGEKLLKKISNTKLNIIKSRMIIRPNKYVIKILESTKTKYFEDLSVYFDDVDDSIDKIWDTLELYRDVIDTLEKTNDGFLTFKTNKIVQTLTVFSVIFMPLTLLSGIYGMNVHLPGSNFGQSFALIVFGMIFSAILMLIYFKRKKWM